MNKYLALIGLFLTIALTGANEMENYKLQGRVKSIEEIQFSIDGEGTRKLIERKIIKFDESGNLTEEIGYDYSNQVIEKTSIVYENSIRKKRIDKYDGHGNVYGYFLVHFEGRNIIESSNYHGDLLIDRTTYIYDERGKLKEEIVTTNVNWMTREITIDYDKEENRIEKTITKDSTFISTYDSKNTIREITTYSDGILSSKKIFNSQGFLVSFFDNSQYGASGTYTYDEKGNKTEEVYFNGDGSLLYNETYKYEEQKDVWGNWITRKVFSKYKDNSHEGNFEPTSMTTRAITYYQ